MGLNYYAHEKPCPHCNKPESRLHIGKSSHGWQFHFAAHFNEHLTTAAEWREFLDRDDVVILDEEDRLVTKPEFLELLEDKSPKVASLKNHYDWCAQKPESRGYLESIYKDADGWTFSKWEFS